MDPGRHSQVPGIRQISGVRQAGVTLYNAELEPLAPRGEPQPNHDIKQNLVGAE